MLSKAKHLVNNHRKCWWKTAWWDVGFENAMFKGGGLLYLAYEKKYSRMDQGKFMEIAFRKFEVLKDHIISSFLKAVFHKLYYSILEYFVSYDIHHRIHS